MSSQQLKNQEPYTRDENIAAWNLLDDKAKRCWEEVAIFKQFNFLNLMGDTEVTDPEFTKHRMFGVLMDIIGWKEKKDE